MINIPRLLLGGGQLPTTENRTSWNNSDHKKLSCFRMGIYNFRLDFQS